MPHSGLVADKTSAFLNRSDVTNGSGSNDDGAKISRGVDEGSQTTMTALGSAATSTKTSRFSQQATGMSPGSRTDGDSTETRAPGEHVASHRLATSQHPTLIRRGGQQTQIQLSHRTALDWAALRTTTAVVPGLRKAAITIAMLYISLYAQLSIRHYT